MSILVPVDTGGRTHTRAGRMVTDITGRVQCDSGRDDDRESLDGSRTHMTTVHGKW
jgi:hypothetical protein